MLLSSLLSPHPHRRDEGVGVKCCWVGLISIAALRRWIHLSRTLDAARARTVCSWAGQTMGSIRKVAQLAGRGLKRWAAAAGAPGGQPGRAGGGARRRRQGDERAARAGGGLRSVHAGCRLGDDRAALGPGVGSIVSGGAGAGGGRDVRHGGAGAEQDPRRGRAPLARRHGGRAEQRGDLAARAPLRDRNDRRAGEVTRCSRRVRPGSRSAPAPLRRARPARSCRRRSAHPPSSRGCRSGRGVARGGWAG